MFIYMIKSARDSEMENLAQIGEECKNHSSWRNRATMDLNRGTFGSVELTCCYWNNHGTKDRLT